ncbi:BglG family transcription antiterminator [Pseudoramibacter faecis]|uniref:BglG family transcription antiterminator n=1 Tax=Pseudoramibacter faecis TaxID=3108534 RepID=UPI002E7827E9|nr:PTS sugar transporter subunit IIA [Pseudoramibacter sp. HA2172]
MNKRTITMIYKLNQSKNETLKSLAETFAVSERTIRNDIKTINDLLDENHLSPVKIKKGQIELSNNFSEIIPFLSPKDYYSYKLSKDERKMIAAAMLIHSAGFITLAQIADQLFASRATIISDLDDIKAMIHDNGLEVTSHPNKGLLVEGAESVKRQCLFKLGEYEFSEAVTGQRVSPMIQLQAGDAITIRKILNEQCKASRLFLSDNSFMRIQKYLGIMISRNLQGEYIEPQHHGNEDFETFARDILRNIAQYCHIRTTEDEAHFLSDLLGRCRYVHKADFNTEDVRIQIITREFIHSLSEVLEVPLENDYDFFENLSNHLQSMYASDSSQFPENADLETIAANHRDVEEAVLDCLDILKNFNPRQLTRGEITYIIVHVCAALERKKNREIAFHVILVCHAGIGTSQLLLEKLKKHFNFQIVDIVSAHEAQDLGQNRADFVISTVPLPHCPLDYVVVSPLFTDEDYLRVGNKIDTLRNSRNLPSRIESQTVTAKGVLEEIRPVLYDHLDQDTAHRLMRDIRRRVRSYFDQVKRPEEDIVAPYLHQLLPKDHIQLDVEASDWRDAIQKSAVPLVKNGYIEPRYIDAMIANVEENGPYIVVSKGFAVPHEGLEMGSVRVGMNLIRLKTPVPFGADELDPVEFVCTMSAVDHKTHLKAFFNLVNMLGDDRFHQALFEAKTPAAVNRIIEQYERQTLQ